MRTQNGLIWLEMIAVLIVIAALFAMGLGTVSAEAGPFEYAATPSVGHPGDGFPTPPEVQEYASREAASPDLAQFAGGHDEEVIVAGCSCFVVAVIIILILL